MKIVILDYATLGVLGELSKLSELGDLISYKETPIEEIDSRIAGAEIVITNKCVLGKGHFEKNLGLKLICILATGTDNVDLVAAAESGIQVKNVSGYSTNSVAQHTFATLFYLVHQLRSYDEYVESGQYAQSNIFTHIAHEYWELAGKTFGVIGLGNIGKRVAEIAKAFGARVIYYSTSGKNKNTEYDAVSLDELLRSSDVVSIHAPLNDDTLGLIGEPELNKMKPESVLINMGRGGIVVEKDLVQALNSQQIFGAVLDVLSKEPMEVNSVLNDNLSNRNLLITPHIAWASKEAREQLISLTLNNVHEYLKK